MKLVPIHHTSSAYTSSSLLKKEHFVSLRLVCGLLVSITAIKVLESGYCLLVLFFNYFEWHSRENMGGPIQYTLTKYFFLQILYDAPSYVTIFSICDSWQVPIILPNHLFKIYMRRRRHPNWLIFAIIVLYFTTTWPDSTMFT